MAKIDKELQEYQSLMSVPDSFEDGFSLSSLLGTLFLALVMIPGCLYMQLIAGAGIGPAAQWVTVILFIEMAKRANARLSRAQLFVLFYIAGLVVSANVHSTPLFRQFLVRSEAAVSFGISSLIPAWVAPTDPDAYVTRSFFQLVWLPAIGLMVFTMFFGQLNQAILGYGLFRVASDIEKLPFPMAPVGAQGIVALAEEVEGTSEGSTGTTSRWRLFCIGGAIGMAFGSIYMALPTLTGAILGTTMSVLPIPFTDWSEYTKGILPATPTGFCFDLGTVVSGMILPYYAMLGSFIGMVLTYIANPLLYKFNVLNLYEPGDKTVEICFKNQIDLYFSLSIGLALAIAAIGVAAVFRREAKDKREHVSTEVPKGRGDIPNWLMISFYFISTSLYIAISGWLIDWHPIVMLVLVFYGFIYTPMISYVTARLEGLAGQVVEIPFIKEISFIISGYKGVAIWFIPVPMANYGGQTVFYRQAELVGTKFTSLWKSNLILMPIVIAATIGFSSFIWSLAEIPSYVYPYTQEMWDMEAKNACLLFSSTLGEYSPFEKALSAPKVATGFGVGMCVYWALAAFNAPVMLFYGLIRGIGSILPHMVIPQFIGALIGRYYFQRKYGAEWRKYVPVLGAGFFVGGGLVSMLCIGIVFLFKSASSLPY